MNTTTRILLIFLSATTIFARELPDRSDYIGDYKLYGHKGYSKTSKKVCNNSKCKEVTIKNKLFVDESETTFNNEGRCANYRSLNTEYNKVYFTKDKKHYEVGKHNFFFYNMKYHFPDNVPFIKFWFSNIIYKYRGDNKSLTRYPIHESKRMKGFQKIRFRKDGTISLHNKGSYKDEISNSKWDYTCYYRIY